MVGSVFGEDQRAIRAGQRVRKVQDANPPAERCSRTRRLVAWGRLASRFARTGLRESVHSLPPALPAVGTNVPRPRQSWRPGRSLRCAAAGPRRDRSTASADRWPGVFARRAGRSSVRDWSVPCGPPDRFAAVGAAANSWRLCRGGRRLRDIRLSRSRSSSSISLLTA